MSEDGASLGIKVIAGLGNPGKEYVGTRHNIGFDVVDALAEEGRGSWRADRSAPQGALVAEAQFGGSKVWLIKPQSFMNRSGEPLASFMSYYKLNVGQLVVVHDEIDIPLGALRIKIGGGDGGHNGIKSIATCLGSKDFIRVRVGVGRPGGALSPEPVAGSPVSGFSVSDWVLQRFPKADLDKVRGEITRSAKATLALLTEPLKNVQSKFHVG